MNALATAPGVIATPGKYYIGAKEVMEYLDCKENNPVNVGDVVVYDKQVNGFKIAFTGSAKSVTVRCFVQGGGTV